MYFGQRFAIVTYSEANVEIRFPNDPALIQTRYRLRSKSGLPSNSTQDKSHPFTCNLNASTKWAGKPDAQLKPSRKRSISPRREVYAHQTASAEVKLTAQSLADCAMPCISQVAHPEYKFPTGTRHGTAFSKAVSENVVRYLVWKCAQRVKLDHLPCAYSP